jgi:lactoylglutathione lyase
MATRKSGKTARAKRNAPRKAKTAPATSRTGAQVLALGSASPSLTVNDLDKSLSWYRDVLGFKVEETWKDDGKVVAASVKAGDVSFYIGQDDWKKGRDRKKGEGFRIFCMTKKSVDALADRILAKGGKLDHGPQDESWGVRDISLTDPDGFKITIAAQKR